MQASLGGVRPAEKTMSAARHWRANHIDIRCKNLRTEAIDESASQGIGHEHAYRPDTAIGVVSIRLSRRP